MGLLDGGIKSIIGNAMDFLFLDFVIIQKSITTPSDTPWQPSDDETDVETACKAIVTSFKKYNVEFENIKAEDRKIVILAEGLDVTPQIGDYIRGDSETKQYEIVSPVIQDPAQATYIIHGR